MENCEPIKGSFRDPSGFLFVKEKEIFRQINHIYRENYDFFMSSGLYRSLVEKELLVPHDEVPLGQSVNQKEAYKIVRPKKIPFISYPYEWCFSELKQAALLTLDVLSTALEHGMILKDASAYNVQFVGTKPIFIDTLSFEVLKEDKPWMGYRQYCQHFLAPLALMSTANVQMSQMLKVYIDGIPLDLASTLLPWKTKLWPSLLFHVHVHAKSQKHFSSGPGNTKQRKFSFSKTARLGLVSSLRSATEKLKLSPKDSCWKDYYEAQISYSDSGYEAKLKTVESLIQKVKPALVWDLGSNTGAFSEVAARNGCQTVAADFDPIVVEKMFLKFSQKKSQQILPLVQDLTNPSSSIGWENTERLSLIERGPADLVMALALIHHIAIANNVPLGKIALFFSKISRNLIIEFVPKADPMVQTLLASREDIFFHYTQEEFEKEFARYFDTRERIPLSASQRTIYLLTLK